MRVLTPRLRLERAVTCPLVEWAVCGVRNPCQRTACLPKPCQRVAGEPAGRCALAAARVARDSNPETIRLEGGSADPFAPATLSTPDGSRTRDAAALEAGVLPLNYGGMRRAGGGWVAPPGTPAGQAEGTSMRSFS
jgi:hypothetical protein